MKFFYIVIALATNQDIYEKDGQVYCAMFVQKQHWYKYHNYQKQILKDWQQKCIDLELFYPCQLASCCVDPEWGNDEERNE